MKNLKCPKCKEDALKHIPTRYSYSCWNCGEEVTAEFVEFVLNRRQRDGGLIWTGNSRGGGFAKYVPLFS